MTSALIPRKDRHSVQEHKESSRQKSHFIFFLTHSFGKASSWAGQFLFFFLSGVPTFYKNRVTCRTFYLAEKLLGTGHHSNDPHTQPASINITLVPDANQSYLRGFFSIPSLPHTALFLITSHPNSARPLAAINNYIPPERKPTHHTLKCH